MKRASLSSILKELDGVALTWNSLGRRRDPEQGRGDMDSYLFLASRE
jgi:hypothetical protein